MSQNWTDDLYSLSTVADTCFSAMENNFAALKTCFSGSSAPSNPLAGMLWFDTNSNILKLRNEANTTWLSVFDFGNVMAILDGTNDISDFSITAGSGLSGGGALNTSPTVSHAAHTGDVTGATALTIGAAKVTQSMLKTTTGSNNQTSGGTSIVAVTGGTYCFQTNCYATSTGSPYQCGIFVGRAQVSGGSWQPKDESTNSSLSNFVTLYNEHGTYVSIYSTTRYVTSSGELHWIFALFRNGELFAITEAPDHPCFGDRGRVHPFESYDPATDEIVVINPTMDDVERINARMIPSEDGGYMTRAKSLLGTKEDHTRRERGFLEVFKETFEIQESKQADWPDTEITVALPKMHDGKVVHDWRFMPQMVQDKKSGLMVPLKINPIKRVIKKPDHITPLQIKEKV